MIDPKVWARWLAAFGDRINKQLGTDASAMYYAILSAELTTEEFEVGMRSVFRSHTYNTWPAPEDIIAVARPTLALTAAAEWVQIEQYLRDRYAEPSGAALATLAAIGGRARWRHLNNWQAEQFRTEFLARYEDVSRLPRDQQLTLSAPRRSRLTGATPVRALLPEVLPHDQA